MTENKEAVRIVDDAQTLATVADESYDIVAAAHVLEHQPRVVDAIEAMLRVTKTEGYVYIILPDVCDASSGDRYRLATKASHFLREFRNTSLLEDNAKEHLTEVSLYYIRRGRRKKIHSLGGRRRGLLPVRRKCGEDKGQVPRGFQGGTEEYCRQAAELNTLCRSPPHL